MCPCLAEGLGFYLQLVRLCEERLVPLSSEAWQWAAQQCRPGALVTSLEQTEHPDSAPLRAVRGEGLTLGSVTTGKAPEVTEWLTLPGASVEII